MYLRGLSFGTPAVASPEVKDLCVEDTAESQAGLNPWSGPGAVETRSVHKFGLTVSENSEILQFRLR
jgi:hypothetical protein